MPLTTFSSLNLNPNINKALDACGYSVPTPVQAGSIPFILAGKDVVACAQTGTGKTAAFVLPALNCVSERRAIAKPRVLILTPTRELATQITVATTKYGKFMRVNLASLVGGMPYRQQLRELSRPVDIIVATPGRLMDHMANGRLDLSGIEMLILDEADRMLDMGFVDDVKAIANAPPKTRQTLLFSATVDNRLNAIIRQLLNNPERVDLSSDVVASPLIEQKIYLADNMQHKNRLLSHFLANENIFKAIIFSATKIQADQLAKQLTDEGFPAGALHGDLKQALRNRTIENFRRNKILFLVATDVAARGIDINDVTHVINYDLPKFSEDYVHRIGRTGRAGKTGIALSFAMPLDTRHLQKIERYIGERIGVHTVTGLEPTKRMAKASGGGAHAERGGKKYTPKSDNNRTGYSQRKEGKTFGARKSSFRDEPRKPFAAGKTSPQDDTRKSFARPERAPLKSYKREERPAAQSYNRDDRFAPKSAPRGDRDKPARSFRRADERPTSQRFARDAQPGAAKRTFAREANDKDHTRARPTAAKRSFTRDDKDKPAGARRTFARTDKAKPAPERRTFSRAAAASEGKTKVKVHVRDSDQSTRAPGRFSKKPATDQRFTESRGKPFTKTKERKTRASV